MASYCWENIEHYIGIDCNEWLVFNPEWLEYYIVQIVTAKAWRVQSILYQWSMNDNWKNYLCIKFLGTCNSCVAILYSLSRTWESVFFRINDFRSIFRYVHFPSTVIHRSRPISKIIQNRGNGLLTLLLLVSTINQTKVRCLRIVRWETLRHISVRPCFPSSI